MKRSFPPALLLTAIITLVGFVPASLSKRGEAKAPESEQASRENGSLSWTGEPNTAGPLESPTPGCTPSPTVSSTDVSGGNGNSIIDRSECNSLNVTLANTGCADLTGVSAVLSTTTPGVVISQANSPYPNIAVGATGTNTVPFGVSTSSTFACGPINLVLTISSNQGTFTVNFSPASCASAPTMVTGNITGTDPQDRKSVV